MRGDSNNQRLPQFSVLLLPFNPTNAAYNNLQTNRSIDIALYLSSGGVGATPSQQRVPFVRTSVRPNSESPCLPAARSPVQNYYCTNDAARRILSFNK
jgi:hypothetical protein